MKRGFAFHALIPVVILMTLTGIVTYVITSNVVRNDMNSRLGAHSAAYEDLAAFFEAVRLIDEHFIGFVDDEGNPLDRETIKQMQTEGAIRGLVAGLGDPWSLYFTEEEYLRFIHQQGSQYVELGIIPEDTGLGTILVKDVFPDSPASRADILPGDIITHVEGISVEEMGYEDAVRFMFDPARETVALTLERPSVGPGSFVRTPKKRPEQRNVIEAATFGEGETLLGAIRISNFNAPAGDNFADAVDRLLEEGVRGLILDVRNNPGGNLEELVQILDHLLPEGDLITLRDRSGETLKQSGPGGINIPMVVLIDRNSYSAAEFFAACIKEFGENSDHNTRAFLMGEQTTGKGFAQTDIVLMDGRAGALHLSTSEYFTPSGRSLAGTGVSPTIQVILGDDERRHIGTMNPDFDRQLNEAIGFLATLLQNGGE